MVLAREKIDLGFHFIGPVMTRKYLLWKRKGADFKLSGIEDIKARGLRLGTVRGDWRQSTSRTSDSMWTRQPPTKPP